MHKTIHLVSLQQSYCGQEKWVCLLEGKWLYYIQTLKIPLVHNE